ncbi:MULTISPECIES: AzlD domain-containing protein [Lysinibacillus]|uniref:AzlD domain-containing protein n=1 Tax=Lysinibacillus pakistanensis TaxID=759811 RepID=A0AAX3X056_9BACI|nr:MULTISPECIES: AzlD domain-containing protein [Lysinibacillus]MDM5231868.1 AzlD domain-containing protein [Lysinibacillus pakistanensis]WHY47404.1 AzlD domain-containing protein [Lysinibacillus pakistanensis]WHY52413.1 AzlD domain-containing protein [Lysinibacillus pakistanensis]
MTTTAYMVWLIIGCALVTWLPRVIPFIFVRNVKLPEIVLKWLSFIPVCILSALVIENLLDTDSGKVVTLNWPVFLTFVPTLIIALLTKSLSITVVAGVIIMAAVRYFM